jgi:dTDP-glucose 4,6-dehydratase
MRILVTGGAGFIGSHFVRTMLASGYPAYPDAHVTVLDNLTYAGDRVNLPATHPRLTFVRGDVCDRSLLRELVPGHDAVVHFAAESHVDRSIADAAAFVRTNVSGTQELLASCAAAKVGRLVHVSTDEVYGSIDVGSWTEDSPMLPNSPYAASKAAADLLARAYWQTHGLDLSVTRCSNNYGPFQHPEKFIPKSITNLLQGLPVPLYGDGANQREWLHVDDHCRAVQLVLAGGRAGEIYHIGGGLPRANRSVAERLLSLAGADRSLLRWVADRPAHDRRYSLDDTKIREQLGYSPRVPFDRGLAETFDWYRANREWWRQARRRAAAA